MQCLLSIGEFVYYFANKQYLTIKHQTKKKLWCGCTTRTIKALENGKELEELEELLEGRFKKTQQHDCHEFMRYYLEMLQEEMNPVIGVGDRKGKTSEEVYSHYLAGHTSIVDYLFAGQLTNLTKCSGCENLSLIHDPFMELVLDIKDTLEISMGKYFGLESIENVNERIGGFV
jgi:ubiquitin C-terminal hydrolase